MDCDNKDLEDIEEMISSNKFSLDVESDKDFRLDCDCPEHEEENNIREGNLAYLIIKKDQEWDICDVICSDCSVRNRLDRYTTSNEPVAVVEVKAMYDISSDYVYFSDPNVWEYIE